MALDDTASLAGVELAFYLLLLPITMYLLVKHGRRGWLAFFYLLALIILRLAASGMQIGSSTSTTASVIDSVGLSTLLLCLAGFLQEAHHYLNQQKNRKGGLIGEIAIHIVALMGVALAAIGGSKLSKQSLSQAQIDSGNSLREVGSIMLLLVWIALVVQEVRLYRLGRQSIDSTEVLAQRLVIFVSVGSIFVGIRTLYSIVYSFDHSPSVSPVTGTLAVKAIFVFLAPLLAVLFIITGAFLSKDISKSVPVYEPGNTSSNQRDASPPRLEEGIPFNNYR